MEAIHTPILTPDQRLRVFVSSTLNELAEERAAVKEAIQNIHLTPVMFEMGARPHAPRNLYRQYLAQSHIFVGIYWDKYGWVAPEEQISGLEDEYNLSGDMPKLIYIKQTQGHREDRLAQLLKRIQRDDKVSYKTFSSADELGNLLINDLAILLTERFNLTMQDKSIQEGHFTFPHIPITPNTLVGREDTVRELIALLQDPDHRLVTLTGPGGIGKTRLATETAYILQTYYPDGVVYVPLAPVRDANLVPETICYALGIKVSGGNMLENLKLFLRDKKFLLVLDNFEQIIDAASVINDLLLASDDLKIMVTSRERLQLSFEYVYIVPALSDTDSTDKDAHHHPLPPAIELFVDRAKAIKPSFELTEANRDIIFQICHRLQGLPLAIELAAGQINLYSPALLLQRLDHQLDVLKGHFRNIPDRQKTIRNTIAWSFDLLSEEEKTVLLQISLFPSGCMFQAIESIAAKRGIDVFEILDALINKSLLIRYEDGNELRFQVLESVREFSIEYLTSTGQIDACNTLLAEYYVQSLKGIKLQRNKVDQSTMLAFLETEHPNIRKALEILMEKRDIEKVSMIAWNLWLFWWINAHTKEGYTWLKQAWQFYQDSPGALEEHAFAILATNVGSMAFLQKDLRLFSDTLVANLDVILKQPDDELVATAALITGVVKTIVKEYEVADRLLKLSLERFRRIGLTTGISLVLSALGRNAVYNGRQTKVAKAYYKESMDLARKDHNEISVIITLSGFALCEVMEQNSEAKKYLREGIALSQSFHFYEALAWSMEIWSLVSINEGKFLHALTLMGAVDHLRQTTQLPIWEDLQQIIVEARDSIKKQVPEEVFDKAWELGTQMNLDEMIAFATEEKNAMAA